MPARNVGINSTFEEQRQVINALAQDVFDGVGGISSTASVNTTGIITATTFYGDGSNLTGVSAGIGSDASGNNSGFFYTNAIGYITENTTVSSPDPSIAPLIFTSYEEIVISDGIDFTIGNENDLLVKDILNLNQLNLS